MKKLDHIPELLDALKLAERKLPKTYRATKEYLSEVIAKVEGRKKRQVSRKK